MDTKLCTSHEQPSAKEKDSVKFALTHWPILAALATGLVMWGVNTANLANAEDKVTELEAKVEAIEDEITTIKNSTTRIETNQTRDQQEQARTQAQLAAIEALLRNLTTASDVSAARDARQDAE